MTEKNELELIALDHIAAMVYQTKLNIMAMERKSMKLPQSKLKDVVILFVQNQKNWLNKLMKGLEKIELDGMMQRDLNSEELDYYAVICEFARQTYDMPAAADLMEHISKCDQIPGWATRQIIDILKPFNHEEEVS